MSARWRRNKRNLKKLDIFKAFSKTKERYVPRTFKIKGSVTKRNISPYELRYHKIPEGKLKEPQPLIDILEEAEEIAVFAEFAGYNKEDLRISVRNQRLTLSAKALGRKYRKSLNLPKRVNPATLYTMYKNGVLEIRLKKAIEEKTIGKIAG